ncbi:MAG: alanine:cation symporter family protein [Turicibacter sp.]|nr:alanine:cation symporter family protein [Turicibacter sp.]
MYETLLAVSREIQALGFFLWTWVFGAFVIVAGIYFSFKTRFAQFSLMKYLPGIITGKDREKVASVDGNKPKNSLSAFQAFAISESSRVGTGNIVGVAVAIVTGGAGAIFWMWAMALFSASTNLIESALGQLYKENHGDRFMGGPMYYFNKAFKSKVPAYVFAVLLMFLYVFVWNSVQANTIVDTFQAYVPHRAIIGGIVAVIIAIIIFGGLKRIVDITMYVLPTMVIIFLLTGTGIVLFNLSDFFQAFGQIITSAFGANQIAGGAIGFTVGQALQQGLRRGIFSNEAGIGSKPIAAATADTSHPVKQGVVNAFGVFLDTLWISSITAFIVLMSPFYGSGLTGVVLIRESMIHFTGGLGAPLFYIMFFLLPFTSIVGNYFYGETCLRFITKNKSAVTALRLLAVVLIFIASFVPLNLVWNIADLFTGTLATLNIFVLFKLSKIALAVLDDYKKQAKTHDPVFNDDAIGGNTSYWKADRN